MDLCLKAPHFTLHVMAAAAPPPARTPPKERPVRVFTPDGKTFKTKPPPVPSTYLMSASRAYGITKDVSCCAPSMLNEQYEYVSD
jgi:hypothetical protein